MKTDFDQELRAYLDAGNTRMGQPAANQGGSAGARWLVYTAAAGSAFAMSSAADAAVVYSGLRNVTVSATTWTNSAPIDLDGDGNFDMYLRAVASAATIWWLDPTWWLNGTASASVVGPARFVLNGSGGVRQLSSGATISSGAGSFGAGSRVLGGAQLTQSSLATDWRGTWLNSVNGIAGLAFDIAGQEHFAWIRLHIDGIAPYGNPSITAIDWAYQDIAGASIRAGQTESATPEPAIQALLLLGGGAIGLAGWRRRRQGKTVPAQGQ